MIRRSETRVFSWVGLVMTICACSRGVEPAHSEQSAQPLSDRFKGLSAPTVKLDIGEDCTDYNGNQGCESDLCLRVEPGDPETGMKPTGFCSIACDPNAEDPGCPDAPQIWRCTQVWPSDQGWFCVPPRSATHGKATHKGGKAVGRNKGQGGPKP